MGNSMLADFYNKMKSGQVSTTSKLDLRNEKRQKKLGNGRIPYLKKDKNKHAYILTLMDIALPFDPFKGEVTEELNRDSLFRPEASAETVILSLKYGWNRDPELKRRCLDLMGVDDWDTSDEEHLLPADLDVFYNYRKPRIFSSYVVTIKSETLTKSKYGRQYRVNWERDDLGNVKYGDGEKVASYPLILKINSFYVSIALEQFDRWEKENMSAQNQVKSDKRREFLQIVPVTKDFPSNNVLLMELEVKQEGREVKVDSLSNSPDELKDLIRIAKYGDLFEKAFNLIQTSQSMNDTTASFYEFDISVPNIDDDAERGRKTNMVPVYSSITKHPKWEEFSKNFKECIDNFEDQEIKVLRSSAPNEVTDELVDKLCDVLKDEIPMKQIKPFITQEISDKYADVLTAIYGDDADELLMKGDMQELEKSSVSDEELKAGIEDTKAILNEDADLEEVDV